MVDRDTSPAQEGRDRTIASPMLVDFRRPPYDVGAWPPDEFMAVGGSPRLLLRHR